MSDPRETRLEDAIREYITTAPDADEGAIVTDWIVLAATYLPEHDGQAHGYWRVMPERQPLHVSLGLLEEARQAYLANGVASLVEEDGDDE
jgi:hypothetical protein